MEEISPLKSGLLKNKLKENKEDSEKVKELMEILEKQKQVIEQIYRQMEINGKELKIVKEKLRKQDQEIERQDQLIQEKNKQLSDLFVNYLKDVQHQKEMQRKVPNYDQIIEVKYFDERQVMDENIRELMNSNLKDMKYIYEKRLNDFKNRYQAVLQGLEKQKALFQLMKQKEEQCDPLFMVTRVWKKINEDAYEMWSILQNVIGNFKIIQVFDIKKTGYGIDYKQIDSIILKLQGGVAAREFDEFKTKLQDNFFNLREKTLQEIKSLQQINDQLKAERRNQDMQIEQQLEKIKLEVRENLKQEWEQKEEKLVREHEQKMLQMYKELDKKQSTQILTELRARFMLMQWYFLVKLDIYRKRFEGLKDKLGVVEVSQSFKRAQNIDLMVGSESAMVGDQLQEQLKLYQYKLQAEENPRLWKRINFQEQKINRLMNELLNQRNLNEIQSRSLRKVQNNFDLMDSAFKKIIARLGMSRIEIDEKDIAQENQDGKNFLKNLQILTKENKKFVQEETYLLIQSTPLINTILYQDRCDQQTNTEIQDLTIALRDQEKYSQMEIEQKWDEEWIQESISQQEGENNQKETKKVITFEKQTQTIETGQKIVIQEKIIFKKIEVQQNDQKTQTENSNKQSKDFSSQTIQINNPKTLFYKKSENYFTNFTKKITTKNNSSQTENENSEIKIEKFNSLDQENLNLNRSLQKLNQNKNNLNTESQENQNKIFFTQNQTNNPIPGYNDPLIASRLRDLYHWSKKQHRLRGSLHHVLNNSSNEFFTPEKPKEKMFKKQIIGTFNSHQNSKHNQSYDFNSNSKKNSNSFFNIHKENSPSNKIYSNEQIKNIQNDNFFNFNLVGIHIDDTYTKNRQIQTQQDTLRNNQKNEELQTLNYQFQNFSQQHNLSNQSNKNQSNTNNSKIRISTKKSKTNSIQNPNLNQSLNHK